MSGDKHLQLENITKNFTQRDGGGEFRAVDNLSLTIHEGEFLTLLGPSGCGKTTTLRLVAGFELPNSGKIILDGKDITNQPPNKRDMALVFQSYALFPHMKVFDNIAYGLQVQKMNRTDIQNRVNEVIQQVGLKGMAERRPNELSGGQQQRVALARCLVMQPRVLLFDEPLSNLDAKLRVQMRSEIIHLQKGLNITSVYVTHDQVEAMAMSDRIVIMNNGIIEQMGSPEDIYRYPVSRFVADFIGRANFVDAKILETHNNTVTADILGKAVTVTMQDTPISNGILTAVLRPEVIRLSANIQKTAATVEQVMYLGSEVEYIVQCDAYRLIVVDNNPRSNERFTTGQEVGIDFIDEAIHLLNR